MATREFTIHGGRIHADSRKGTWWLDPDDIKDLSADQRVALNRFFTAMAGKLEARNADPQMKSVDELEAHYRDKWPIVGAHAYMLRHRPVGRDVFAMMDDLLHQHREHSAAYQAWEESKPRHVAPLTKNKEDYLEHLLAGFDIACKKDAAQKIPAEEALLIQLKTSSIKQEGAVAAILENYEITYKDPAEKRFRGNPRAALINAIMQQEQGFQKLSG